MPRIHFKILTLFAVVILCLSATAFAADKTTAVSEVSHAEFYLGNEKSEYPFVRTANFDASYKINRDIENYLADMRAAFDSAAKVTSKFEYKLCYEDSKTVSLTFNEYRYYDRAAHGDYKIHGVVYNKETGDKVPLENYLKITPQQLQELIDNNTAKVYGGDGNALLSASDINKIKYISADYYLTNRPDGMYIGIIYPPYELAPWSTGIINILVPMPKG